MAPEEEDAFRAWYGTLVRWDQVENSADPQTSSPALRSFYAQLSRAFPPASVATTRLQDHGHRTGRFAGFRTRLAGYKAGRHETSYPPAFNEACMTDYSFAEAAIYLCFSWSVSDKALRATLDAAIKAGVGVFNVSAADAQPVRNKHDLIALRSQLKTRPDAPLSKADLFNALQAEGWTVNRDRDDGSRLAMRHDGGKIFYLLPDVRVTAKGTRIDWREAIVPNAYIRAVSIIANEPKRYYPLAWRQSTKHELPNMTVKAALAGLGDVLSQLANEDLDKSLEETASLPLSSPGNGPIRLLAAKACRGDCRDLHNMRDKMLAGDRQGFVPYVTVAHLERAIEACRQLHDGSP